MDEQVPYDESEPGLLVHPAQTALVPVRYGGKEDAARREGLLVWGLTGAVRLSLAAATLPLRMVQPVLMSRPLQPARTAADSMLQTTLATLTALLQERPHLTDELVRLIADRYVAALAVRPELLAVLVQNVAAGYLAYLQEHPEALDELVQARVEHYFESACADPAPLQRVVQAHGDRYIEHLNEQPANVQELLTGQSVSMATEMVKEVRVRSSSADNLVEKIARGLLRKKPRQELGPPTPAAGQRADSSDGQ